MSPLPYIRRPGVFYDDPAKKVKNNLLLVEKRVWSKINTFISSVIPSEA
jgi:hypothetical protein